MNFFSQLLNNGSGTILRKRAITAALAVSFLAILTLFISAVFSGTRFLSRKIITHQAASQIVDFSVAGDGFTAVENHDLRMYSKSGKEKAGISSVYSSPRVSSCSFFAAIFSHEESEITLLYPDGSSRLLQTETCVSLCSANEDGTLSVIHSSDDSFSGSFELYDRSLSLLFYWESRDESPVSARLTDKRLLLLHTRSQYGDTLHIYDTSLGSELGNYCTVDQKISSYGAFSDGRVGVAAGSALHIFAANGIESAAVSFSDVPDILCSIDDYAAIAAGSSVALINSEGRSLGRIDTGRSITNIQLSDQHILVCFTEEAALYSLSLEEIVSYQGSFFWEKCVLTASDIAYFVSDSEIVRVDFSS